jgi:hypothetical protein
MQLHMAGSFAFDGRAIRQLRNEATKWWFAHLPADLPQGWTKCPFDPTPLVDFFAPLQVKEGYVLRAYLYRNYLSTTGIVWALPEGADLPDAGVCPPNSPPRPPLALHNVMAAIEGDCTPWSYLCASILARELESIGSRGEADTWSKSTVLDADPWLGEDRSARGYSNGYGNGYAKGYGNGYANGYGNGTGNGATRLQAKGNARWPGDGRAYHAAATFQNSNGGRVDGPSLGDRSLSTASSRWRWRRPRPLNWQPDVFVNEITVRVRFYAFNNSGQERILLFEDLFEKGNYVFERAEQPIADGPIGIPG